MSLARWHKEVPPTVSLRSDCDQIKIQMLFFFTSTKLSFSDLIRKVHINNDDFWIFSVFNTKYTWRIQCILALRLIWRSELEQSSSDGVPHCNPFTFAPSLPRGSHHVLFEVIDNLDTHETAGRSLFMLETERKQGETLVGAVCSRAGVWQCPLSVVYPPLFDGKKHSLYQFPAATYEWAPLGLNAGYKDAGWA